MFWLFVGLLLACPVLWLISLHLLGRWRRFRPFFALNLVLVFSYLVLLTSVKLPFLGHDEYGLAQLAAVLAALMLHVVLGFGFAVGWHLSQRTAV